MHIGLDARAFCSPSPRGIGRSLLEIYRRVVALRPDWRFTLYHQGPQGPLDDGRHVSGHAASGRPAEPWEQPNVQPRRIDIPGDRFDAWLQVRLPVAAWRDRVDLLHFPANAAPACCPTPFVATIHDLIPLQVDDEVTPGERRAFLRGVRRAVRGARHIVAVSQATRAALCETFSLARQRISVIHWASGSAFDKTQHTDRRKLCARYAITRPWLFACSGSARRKNAVGLIKAVRRLPDEVRRSMQLVLVGCEPAGFREQLAAEARRLGVADDCRILGYVPDHDLCGLLSQSRGLVMASLLEGFGLPILDAFAAGVPVLTSNIGSMPEIAGDAAVYCDPYSVESISAGMLRLLDKDTAATLVENGRRRNTQFSWERSAAALCDVYELCRHRRSNPRHASARSLTPRSVRIRAEEVC